MEEELKDVSPVEETSTEEADLDEATEAEESSTSEENRIPHSRVKEMERKAYERGQQEALKKLLSGEEDASVEPDEAPTEPKADDKSEAMKLLREAIRKEVEPLRARAEVKDFLKANPDAVNYADKIKDLRKRSPGLTWDDAYKLASFDDKVKNAERKGLETGQGTVKAKQMAQTEKPTAAPKVEKGDIVSKLNSLSSEKAAEELKNFLRRG